MALPVGHVLIVIYGVVVMFLAVSTAPPRAAGQTPVPAVARLTAAILRRGCLQLPVSNAPWSTPLLSPGGF
mgnify:CR=1 FL=1